MLLCVYMRATPYARRAVMSQPRVQRLAERRCDLPVVARAHAHVDEVGTLVLGVQQAPLHTRLP